MRVVLINKSDALGGAAVVTRRLMEALCQAGVDAKMLVAQKYTQDERIYPAASGKEVKRFFLEERAEVFISNGFSRKNLFKVDPASFGLPLWQHPIVKEADAVILNWVNQGMLSLKGVAKIAEMKPVIWTMHDLWNATGICHHSGKCLNFEKNCGNCPLLGWRASSRDLSFKTHKRKLQLYKNHPIRFVAVSSWLEKKCRESSLMKDASIQIIPNPFFSEDTPLVSKRPNGALRAVVAAARLDDDVKGFPILLKALEELVRSHKSIADRLTVIYCGDIRDKGLLNLTPVKWEWKGSVSPEEMPNIFADAELVISSSRYETLPGTLVEGQAQGAFPVAFDRGGQRDIIQNGETGVLADFGMNDDEASANLSGAIVKASEIIDMTDYQILAQRLKRSVKERFSAEEVAKKYISLITDCVSAK